MDVPHNLLDAAAVLVSNPYAVEVKAAENARQRLAQADAPAAAATLLARGAVEPAETLLLAQAALQACAPNTQPQDVVPEALWRAHPGLKQLPHPRESYLRVATAHARCQASLEALAGGSPAMGLLRQQVWAVSFGASLFHGMTLERVIRDHDVLIVGETGTGKETVANAILEGIQGGPDGSAAPRTAINAAALPETLTEGELFGHAKGAYTGATEHRVGRIRAAHGGGFFLDEVGDLPLATQSKLLRVIELDEVAPLGSDKVYNVDVRFIAATHRNLLAMAQDNRFRRDLYERLAGCVIQVPPLRERPQDIPVIGMRFVHRMMTHPRMAPQVERMEVWLNSPQALSQRWGGNVRELYNALRNLMLGLPATAAFPSVGAPSTDPAVTVVPGRIMDAQAPLTEVEDWYMQKVLTRVEGNLALASRILGVDRSTLRRHTRRWGS